MDKAHVLAVGVRDMDSVDLGMSSLPLEKVLRFLGVAVHDSGTFLPWRDSYDKQLYTLRGKLAAVGLGCTPVAFIRGLSVSILPSLLYGCEIWGISHVYDVVLGGASPYRCGFMDPIITFLRSWLSLPRSAPVAAIHRLV